MAQDTPIEWTDKTWNPVRGCSRVSEGCRNCYAEGIAARFSGPGLAYEGLATMGKNGPRWTGEVRFVHDHIADPFTWKRPARVFVNSMSDLFHEKLTNEEIAVVFAVMAACPQHTFQVLTKRPARVLDWFRWIAERPTGLLGMPYAPKLVCAGLAQAATGIHWTVPEPSDWPLPNVWLGVSVEDQATADERIPLLLKAPAAVRFISAEPLLGPIDLRQAWERGLDGTSFEGACERATYAELLQWVIVGGESGRRARPCAVEWIRRVVDQCREAFTPVFVKQLGTFVVSELRAYDTDEEAKRNGFDSRWLWRAGLAQGNTKGGDLNQFTPELNIRMFPGDPWAPVVAGGHGDSETESPF